MYSPRTSDPTELRKLQRRAMVVFMAVPVGHPFDQRREAVHAILRILEDAMRACRGARPWYTPDGKQRIYPVR